jgi:hypothetical protein
MARVECYSNLLPFGFGNAKPVGTATTNKHIYKQLPATLHLSTTANAAHPATQQEREERIEERRIKRTSQKSWIELKKLQAISAKNNNPTQNNDSPTGQRNNETRRSSPTLAQHTPTNGTNSSAQFSN